jgi:hypothetical protein
MSVHDVRTRSFVRLHLTLATKGGVNLTLPPNKARTRLVGVAAFLSIFLGLKLAPSKWRSLVPPTSG